VSFDEELFGLALDYADSTELSTLKKRFEGFSICKDMATAAAFGYLAAMRDGEEKEEHQIFDMVMTTIDNHDSSSCESAEIVMGLIYLWLKEAFTDEGFAGTVLDFLEEKFAPYVKPGVIKQ
jgi:hypothetical protein